MPRRLVDRFPLVIVAVDVQDIVDEIQGKWVVLDLRVEAGEVEAVGKVIFVNFAKILVSSR